MEMKIMKLSNLNSFIKTIKHNIRTQKEEVKRLLIKLIFQLMVACFFFALYYFDVGVE